MDDAHALEPITHAILEPPPNLKHLRAHPANPHQRLSTNTHRHMPSTYPDSQFRCRPAAHLPPQLLLLGAPRRRGLGLACYSAASSRCFPEL